MHWASTIFCPSILAVFDVVKVGCPALLFQDQSCVGLHNAAGMIVNLLVLVAALCWQRIFTRPQKTEALILLAPSTLCGSFRAQSGLSDCPSRRPITGIQPLANWRQLHLKYKASSRPYGLTSLPSQLLEFPYVRIAIPLAVSATLKWLSL